MDGQWKGRPAMLAAAGIGVAGGAALWRARQDDLSGQTALITGGSGGLGLLLAREFGRAGCKIAICARDKEELARAQTLLERWVDGVEVLAVPCDVTEPGQVARMVRAVTQRFGQIDILVNNAGIIQVGPARAMSRADYQRAMDLMFWGVFNTVEAVLPSMRDRKGGRIVNITSVGGKVSVPHLLPYNSAKFAAVGFSEGLRAELAQDGVTVVTICPGEMRTGSFLAAEFKGRQPAEYAWFATASSLPFLSIDAERAARQIVAATRRGQAERILSLPASLLVRFHGLFPGVTADLLGIVARLQPPPVAETPAVPGAAENGARPVLRRLTGLDRSAARRFNEPRGA